MRISTNTIYQSGISKINNLQVEQVKLQQQISTGRRIDSPSDDPVAAARALEVSYAKGINAKYTDTRQAAQLKLNTLESSLTTVTNLLVSTQSTLIAAGNGSYSNQERGFIGSELNGTLQQLLGLANTKDSSGNYLYAGFKTNTLPYDGTEVGVAPAVTSYTYNGDGSSQLLQVESSRQMAVTVPGSSVFQGSNDVFATLKNISTLLNTPITNAAEQAAFNAGLSTAISKMQSSVDNILNIRADIGSKLNELDGLELSGSDRDLQYSKSLSELQDLDYATALSDLAKQQTIMEAAQKSFVSTTSLSLFKYI